MTAMVCNDSEHTRGLLISLDVLLMGPLHPGSPYNTIQCCTYTVQLNIDDKAPSTEYRALDPSFGTALSSKLEDVLAIEFRLRSALRGWRHEPGKWSSGVSYSILKSQS